MDERDYKAMNAEIKHERMTAVEWLIEKHFGGIINCTPEFRLYIYEAKEMEKQQIVDSLRYFGIELAEQYYNETFKNTEK